TNWCLYVPVFFTVVFISLPTYCSPNTFFCTIVPTAVPTPYNCYTLLSAEPCQAAKQFIQPHLLPPEVVLYPEDEVDLGRSSSGVRDTGEQVLLIYGSCEIKHGLNVSYSFPPEPKLSGSSASPAVFSGVGLTQGLLWVATGTFLLINGSQCN
uniref:Uncharacterized protein n=1 Tax=Oncorhynchus mykiss TaxID=8022 RepID=A0A8K9UID7_ONCMY